VFGYKWRFGKKILKELLDIEKVFLVILVFDKGFGFLFLLDLIDIDTIFWKNYHYILLILVFIDGSYGWIYCKGLW